MKNIFCIFAKKEHNKVKHVSRKFSFFNENENNFVVGLEISFWNFLATDDVKSPDTDINDDFSSDVFFWPIKIRHI